MAEFESLSNWFERTAEDSPGKTAIYFEDHLANPVTQSTIQFGTLLRQVALTAKLLKHRHAVAPGDRIAWLGFNHPEMFTLILAAASIGAVVVPLNWRLADEELEFILEDAEPLMLFHDHAHFNKANVLAGNLSYDDNLACVQFDGDSGDSLVAQRIKLQNEAAESSAVSPGSLTSGTPAPGKLFENNLSGSEPAMIVYTSGTTGRPKGAVISHKAMICNARMSQHMYDLTKSDIVLGVLPLFHIGGINIQPLPALLHGATVVLQQKFQPGRAVASIEEHGITLVNTVPTILRAMIGTSEWESINLASLKSISIGSTDVPIPLIELVHERQVPVVQVYGATETSPIAIYQLATQAYESVGSIGQAGSLCDILLTDPEGDTVGKGLPGEIRVKGDNILSEYWNNDEATRYSIEDGWFKTGDVAYMDEQGYYWFCDRLKHVIISGGENIYPAEIERVISQVNGVESVCVVGQDDKVWGQVPLAVVEICKPTLSLESEILSVCRKKLANFKIPREVVMTGKLPRNAMGKILIGSVKAFIANGKSDTL